MEHPIEAIITASVDACQLFKVLPQEGIA